MIDTHCHLNFEAFEPDVNEVIKRAEQSGVKKFIVPGAKLDSSEKAILLSQQFGNVFSAVGFHPHHIDELDEKAIDRLKFLLKDRKVVAIGEVGLDLHNYKNKGVHDISLQKTALEKQLDLAVYYNKPCIFHCRDAHEEIDDFLKSYKLRGVFHCFTGNLEHLKRVLGMGFYVSFTGNVTYDGSYDLLIKEVPIDRLLLETDSPLLSPVPFRGQRNEPKNLLIIADYVSKVKNMELNDLLERSTINAGKLFNLC